MMKHIQDTLHVFKRTAIYGLPLGGLTAAAILVGVFTPLGIVTGFAMAAGVMVIGGAVVFRKMRADKRQLSVAVLLMLVGQLVAPVVASASTPAPYSAPSAAASQQAAQPHP